MASQKYEIQIEEYGPNGDEEDAIWAVLKGRGTVFRTDIYSEAEAFIAAQGEDQ